MQFFKSTLNLNLLFILQAEISIKLNTRKRDTNQHKLPPAQFFLKRATKSNFPGELQFSYNHNSLKRCFYSRGKVVVNLNKEG